MYPIGHKSLISYKQYFGLFPLHVTYMYRNNKLQGHFCKSAKITMPSVEVVSPFTYLKICSVLLYMLLHTLAEL